MVYLWFMACIRGADRCRHYMVEMQSNGKYVILGEDRAHSSLTDLVQYHTQVGIKPFIELLTLPCGQVSVLRSVLGRLLWNVISYRLQVTLFKM